MENSPAAENAGQVPDTDHVLDFDQYLLLMRELQGLKTALGEDGRPCSPLLKSISALQSVVWFLHADPMVMKHSLTAPLEQLAAALSDKIQGAKSHFLDDFERSHRTNPTDLHRDITRGQVVVALNVLISAGQRPKIASSWIISEMRRLGFKDQDPKPLRWRYKHSDGSAPDLQRQATAEITKDQLSQGAPAQTEAEARNTARLLLQAARRHDF